MKTKHFLYGGLSLGVTTALVRIFEYLLTIDEQGFYRADNTANFLNGCLIGLILVGCVWSFLSKGKQKEQVSAAATLPRGGFTLIFGGLAAISAAIGLYRIFLAYTYTTPDFALPSGAVQSTFNYTQAAMDWPGMLVGALCLLGAIGWIVLCFRRETGFALLPVLQLGALVIDYFWATYQYIHVSGYILMTLALCILIFYTMSLAKVSAGATCSRGRLTVISVLILCIIPACLIEGFFHPTLPNLMLVALALLYYVLAVATLVQPANPQPEPCEEINCDAPDLSELNHYFSEIPEEESTNEENN